MRGAGSPRRWAVALLAVAAVLAPTLAKAQGTDLPLEHSFVAEAATYDLRESVDTSVLTFSIPDECGEGGDPDPGELLVASGDGSAFTFSEPRDSMTGCAEATYNLTFPAPVRTVRVNFTVDRRQTPEANTVPPLVPPFNGSGPASFAQEFRLTFPDGSHRIEPYFGTDQPSAPEQVVESEFRLPVNSTWVRISWYFEDEGLGAVQFGADTGRARMASTVRAIAVEALEIPLAAPTVEAAPEVEDREALRGSVLYWVNVTLPQDAVRAAAPGVGARTSDLVLEVRRGPTLLQRVGPQGPVPSEVFEARREGDAIFYVIDRDTVATMGPGVYTFQFETLRQLPAPAAPGPPQRIEPFFFMMLLLPAPAAVLSLYSALAYRREAEGRYRRASVGILALVLVGIVYYLLLLLYAIFGAKKAVMTTLPLVAAATLVYIQLIVLLLFFAVTAVVVGRYLVRGMRRDLEARRVQEERLRRSNEELERFAYVASHDLQEPLRKVAGFTSLLQRRYKGRLDKDADEMIQYAVDGATRMQALIRDILAYSRVGSAELDVKPVEAGAVMELVASDLGEKIKEEKASVVWEGLPTVPADAGQLRQVLQNLVENAVKYRDPKRRPKVRISAERVGPDWRFAVADNGLGIPADKLHDVFGIFRRLHGAEVPGTGIGLALAKKAIERHGGRIWVESKPGRGSTFYFTIPSGEGATAPRLAWRTPAEGLRPGQPTGVPPA